MFPVPAVAGLMQKMVEARIHNDGDDQEVVREWQRGMINTYATPSFALVDPASDSLIDHHEGAQLDADEFARWLEQAYGKWEAH